MSHVTHLNESWKRGGVSHGTHEQGSEDAWEVLFLQVIFHKRAIRLMALLRKQLEALYVSFISLPPCIFAATTACGALLNNIRISHGNTYE